LVISTELVAGRTQLPGTTHTAPEVVVKPI
jgi:hypothetical protein